MLDKEDTSSWEDEDWDKLSVFHKIHRQITGIPLTYDMIKFYILLIVVSIVFSIFLN